MKRIVAIAICFTVLFSSCTSNNTDIENKEQINPKIERIIAAWIYYNEIEEFVNKSNSEEEFKNNISNAIDKLIEYSVNTVILHIRAFDDAFYVSSIFPVSQFCDDSNGNLKFDVLKCFLEVCHSKNMKVWGWINPYRINKVDDTSNVKEGYFQFDAIKSCSEIIIHSKNGVYYNPADSAVKKHIIDGIREILDNYEVDGIHFDDYFYPRTDDEFDKSYYDSYKSNGGTLNLNDFRRENVNSLIMSVYSLVKSYGKDFSISPVSDIDKNYNSMYADVKLWATSDSYVDYIIPQIYFGFQNPIQPFSKTLNKWIELTGDSEKLLIGLALYKSGVTENYAKDGKDEWKSREVISKEIEEILKYKNIGFVYYSASFIYNPTDEGIAKEINNIKNTLNANLPTSAP